MQQTISEAMARILLVEDSAELRESLVLWLTSVGHVVVAEVDHGDEVLAAVLSTEPDVVLLDICLPGRSGLDVLPELCTAAPKVITIMLSSHCDPSYVDAARHRGATDYVVKQEATQQLARAIAGALAQRVVVRSP